MTDTTGRLEPSGFDVAKLEAAAREASGWKKGDPPIPSQRDKINRLVSERDAAVERVRRLEEAARDVLAAGNVRPFAGYARDRLRAALEPLDQPRWVDRSLEPAGFEPLPPEPRP